MNDMLKKIYYDVDHPASFSSADRLFLAARELIPGIKIDDVKKFLSGELTFTLHKRVVRKFKRNPVVSNHYEDHCQADLVDIQRYQQDNEGFRYILTVIDVFTKIAFAVPIKSKDGNQVSDALQKIFSTYRPNYIQTDEGNEFKNAKVKNLFKRYSIKWFPATNEHIKCAIVERFQRTLMTKIHKFMTSTGNRQFVQFIERFVNSYNKTYHRSIKMTPNEAKAAPVKNVFMNLYGVEDERSLLKRLFKSKIPVGTSVRIAETKNRFAKGYAQNFTDAVYKVATVVPSLKTPTFKLIDHKGKPIKGRFYNSEIQKIENPDLYRVSIIGERKRGRGKQYLVHYVNFPDTEDQWIPASRIQDLS